MSKGQTDRRQQREFLFVLNSKPTNDHANAKSGRTETTTCVRHTDLKSDEAQTARNKLIEELREFGC